VDILKNQELTEDQLKYQKAEIKAMIDAGQFDRARFVRLFGAAYNVMSIVMYYIETRLSGRLREFATLHDIDGHFVGRISQNY
jgi:hypothetical protein